MPLSNSTVNKRLDEMSEDIEMQLVEKPKTRKISVKLGESILGDSEVVLITYMTQPILADLSDISDLQSQELSDASVKPLFTMKGVMAWIREETGIKYLNATKCARELFCVTISIFIFN
ncbi:hypothetical protein NPIL_512661 [Nephila pilipes]|uniref:Uncharacterized protein n=1 Tax=Nephila pilipes TaxID=299642 RepID=A0A8X6QKN4_NEPPI|nr:hypothetical protein NPIL_512661 [Nephila pilipes]